MTTGARDEPGSYTRRLMSAAILWSVAAWLGLVLAVLLASQ
jgi:hypothetical protein